MAAGGAGGRVVAGRYELRSLLGRGGMGQVWLAHDALLHRDVAVKEVTFPPSFTEGERRDLRDRTLREARAAARFEHPRVTTVHDVLEQDGQPWIVMEHVPSRSLAEWVQAGPLPVHRVVRIGLDVLAALTAAHRAGIVHRDVKPANVLVSDQGRAWLTDFGIASSTGESRLTGHGVLLGSPSYIAPERARGDDDLGPSVDVWGLGATLYFAVEGRPPFDRGEGMATLLAIISEQPPRPVAAGPLEPLLTALLSRDPAQRPTVEQAATALRSLLESSTAAAPAGAVRPQAEPPLRVPADSRRAEPSDGPERIDLGELAGLAAASTKALAGSAARHVAGRYSRPVPPAPVRPPAGRPARSTSGWRFKRRWVVAPLAVVAVVVVVVVALLGLVLEALLG